jgi:hypothetical protein
MPKGARDIRWTLDTGFPLCEQALIGYATVDGRRFQLLAYELGSTGKGASSAGLRNFRPTAVPRSDVTSGSARSLTDAKMHCERFLDELAGIARTLSATNQPFAVRPTAVSSGG